MELQNHVGHVSRNKIVVLMNITWKQMLCLVMLILRFYLSLSTFEARCMIMTDSHKDRLRSCYEVLVNNMSVDSVLISLVSEYILTFGECDEITKAGVRAKQVQAFINTLIRKPDHAFDKLVDALRSTQQDNLAILLTKPGKSSVLIMRYLVCCTVI